MKKLEVSLDKTKDVTIDGAVSMIGKKTGVMGRTGHEIDLKQNPYFT